MHPYISTCVVVDVKFLPVISSFLTNDNIGLSVFCAYVENNKYTDVIYCTDIAFENLRSGQLNDT